MARGKYTPNVREHPESPGRWQARWTDPTGAQRSKTFPTKTAARNHVHQTMADMKQGRYIDESAARQTLDTYAERWLRLRRADSELREATVERDRYYVKIILAGFGRRQIGTIRASEIDEWLSELTGVSRSSRSKLLSKLRSILELARRDEAIRANPAADAKRQSARSSRPRRALESDSELQALLDAAESVKPSQAVLVWLMAFGGLRLGEAIGLPDTNVDLASGTIEVLQSASGGVIGPVKGKDEIGQGRSIRVPQILVDRIRSHQSQRDSRVRGVEGLLVTGATGRPVRERNWRRRVWYPIVEHAGIGQIYPHDLRRTAATRLFTESHWTPAEVQAFMGHQDARVTLDVYARVSPQSLPQPAGFGAGIRAVM